MAAEPRYDRAAASAILATLARPGLFAPVAQSRDPLSIEVTRTGLAFLAGDHLTADQRLYLETSMPTFPAELVTSAQHQIMWTDSRGVHNIGHVGQQDFAFVVPVAVREVTLALWDALSTNTHLLDSFAALSDDQQAILAGTASEGRPLDIFRIGIDTTGRAVAQHALLAHHTSFVDAADLARAMVRDGLFSAVAVHWFWGLQSSTFRRGMVPAQLAGGDRLAYSSPTVAALKRMKEATITQARQVMHQAITVEGLSPSEAATRYADDLDLIPRQYVSLPPDVVPRCLANVPHDLGAGHATVLGQVAEHFVDAFASMLPRVKVMLRPVEAGESADQRWSAGATSIAVPDMSCASCESRLRRALSAADIVVVGIDLTMKLVTVDTVTPAQHRHALDVIRAAGYTPDPI